MRNRARHFLVPLAVTLMAAAAAVTASVASDSTSLPTTVPSTATPDINDADGNTVLAVTRVGSRIIVGGLFQSATNHGSTTPVYTRSNILAFDAATGLIDTGFAPVVDGEVYTLMPGPTPDTVYVGGQFSHVGGVNHFKIVELSTVTGAPVTTFKPMAPNGIVTDMATSHGHLILGGTFTTVGSANARGGLASMDPTTGTLDSFVTVTLAGHHNWVTGSTGAKSGVGVDRFDVSPDGNKLVIVGNFKTVNGVTHDQAVLLDLSGASATVMPWIAPGYTATCNSRAFDEWVRDVAFSQDGSYFVIVGTGGPNATYTSLCDAAERFNLTDANNTASQPVWIDHTGGDTILSVATTTAAIYIGGHFRWLNNTLGRDSAQPGAVERAGIAALDPRSGLPMAWNPGHHPRGFGIQGLYVDDTGLYVGSDEDFFGYAQYNRAKIGFLPFAGGYTPPAGQVATLPAKIYQTGIQNPLQPVLYRIDAGGPTVASTDSGPDWVSDNTSTSPYHGTGGTIVSFANQITKTDPSLPAGTPLQLFSSLRYMPTTAAFKWSFPVAVGASVQVHLFYADRTFPAFVPGQRVFGVTIDSTVVEPSMDIVATFGQNTAGMKSYDVTSDGSVDITFTPSADKPEISAIEIVRVGNSTGAGIGARTYDGTSVGVMTAVGGADGTPWANLRGAMLIDGTLFYGMTDANFYKRTFDGSNVGPAFVDNPHSDPAWNGKATGSGTSTYTGVKSSFYSEITSLAGLYYDGNGKMFYTRTGRTQLFWRWFNPDSGITGADEFTVASAQSFANPSGVLFMSGGNLYWSTTNGNLNRIAWTGTTTSGSAAVASGPGVDGQNWATNGAFIGQ